MTAAPFIVGAVRSGTQRLRRMLGAHPGIDALPEAGLAHMRSIARAQPEARFIHVIQDGRDGVTPQSGDLAGQAQGWQAAVERAREDGAGLRHYLEVRYEQFALNPEPALREICGFLDVEFDSRMLGSQPEGRETRKHTDVIGRWADVLSRAELLAFEQAAGATLTSLGYATLAQAAVEPARAEAVAQTKIRLAARRERARDFETAEECYRDAARLAPGNIRYIERLVQFLERIGRFTQAWDALEDWARSTSPPSEWAGGSIAGKRVLLHRRIRGLGAEIRQARLISCVAREAESCTVVAEPRIARLYSRSFPQARVIHPGESPPPFDCSLGYEQVASIYGRSEQALRDTFVPLIPDADEVRQFRTKYHTPGKYLVGFAWWSSNERKRMPGLEDWRPLLAAEHCQFVSLQYGDVAGDLAVFNEMAARPLIADASVDQLVDMDRFASQVAALDAIVLISCTAAHLAGALSKPTVVLFHEDDIQTWQHGREDSPWFPTVRILQRGRSLSWRDVVERAAGLMTEEALRALQG